MQHDLVVASHVQQCECILRRQNLEVFFKLLFTATRTTCHVVGTLL